MEPFLTCFPSKTYGNKMFGELQNEYFKVAYQNLGEKIRKKKVAIAFGGQAS